MTFQPFLCFCGHAIRGDAESCPNCGAELYPSAFTRGEQQSEDRVAA